VTDDSLCKPSGIVMDTNEVLDGLATIGRTATAKPNWRDVLKFKFTADEREALRDYREKRRIVDVKLGEVDHTAVSRLRKGPRERAIATAFDETPRPAALLGVTGRELAVGAKKIRSGLKEARGNLNAAIGKALLDAGNRLHIAAQEVIEKVVTEHESSCRRFGMEPLPNGLVGVLRTSLSSLERALSRGHISPSVLEQYIELPA